MVKGSHHWMMKADLHRIKSGTGLKKGRLLFRTLISCDVCPWRGSLRCPHGIGPGGSHSNGSCSDWALYVRDNYELAGTKPKLFQQASLLKDQVVSDDLYRRYVQAGSMEEKLDIASTLSKVQRNIISSVDKMRRQDEGVKVQQDVNITMDEFRRTVDAQAKVIEVEEQDKPGGDGSSGDEVQDV